jgi:SP family arabinose:H+ symporter-like MFS transporter
MHNSTMSTLMSETTPRLAGSVAPRNTVLLLVAIVALLGGFLFGYDTAVINGANQYFKTHFALNSFQEGIAGASAILGCIPGAMVAGILSDKFGRRRVLFLCGILYAASAIFSAVPRNFTEFLIARFIGGLGIGASSMVCPVYVAELAPAAWRGRMGSLFQFGIVSGIFLTLFINAQIQGVGDEAWNVSTGWRWMLGAEAIPAFLFLAVLFFAKESPRWLIQVGREDEARNVLERAHGKAVADAEIAATREVLKQSEAGFFEMLFEARFRRLLMIASLLMAFSQFSGINAIMYYSTKIFTTAGVGVKDSFMASAVIGLINLLFTLIAVALVDKAGRRILLLVGLTAQVIALGTVGWMFHAGIGGVALLSAVLAFIAAFAMALGPIPWILCSEIFPTRVRGRAMSVATFTIWTSCYIVAQTFPMLNDSAAIGPAKTFWIYAACSLVAWFFVLRMVPETKGRSLEEIEAQFQPRNS